MKLVSYDEGKVGRIEGEEIVGLDAPDMRSYFERAGASENGERSALATARLRAPIVPKKFFHTAGNFREHEEESKNVGWSHEIAPWIVFFQNVDAIVGPDEPIVYPEHLTEELDYELELAVVIAKSGKWFSPEEAEAYIGGYVIFNDITARDIQRREMRSGVFSFCKAIDSFCPLGPWIVTPDEIPTRTTSRWSCGSTASRASARTRAGCRSRSRRSSPITPRSATARATFVSTGTVSGWPASATTRPRSTSVQATSSRPRSSGSASCETPSSPGRRHTASPRRPGSAFELAARRGQTRARS